MEMKSFKFQRADQLPDMIPYTGPLPDDMIPYSGPIPSQEEELGFTASEPAPGPVQDRATDPGPEPAGSSGELPDPSLTMYDDLGRGAGAQRRAFERYQQYANHPEATRSVIGEVLYRGKVVPPPGTGILGAIDTAVQGVTGYDPGLGSPSPSSFSFVPGIVRNAIKGTTQTVGAVTDFVGDKTGLSDGEPGMISRVGGSMAEIDPGDSTLNKIAIEGGQLIIGGLGGLKAVDKGLKAFKALENAPVLRNLAKVVGFEVGAVSAANPEAETILVGDKAMLSGLQENLPILKGIPVDADDKDYEVILKRRTNMLADAAMLAKPAEAALKGVAWTARLTWSVTIAPFLKAGSRSAQEEAIAAEILDNLALVGKTDDEASLAAQQRITQLIRDNAEVFAQTNDAIVQDMKIGVDTMTALERALKAENTNEARQIIAKARGMRSGVLNAQGGAPQLADTLGGPARAFEDVTQRVETQAGGSEAIEGARAGIVESGQRQVGMAQANVDALGSRLADAETNIVRLIQEDPTFGSRIDQLSRASGINIYAGRNQASDQIVANVRAAFETMDAQKDALYGAIEGGAVDPGGMAEILARLRPGQLDAAAGALPANSQFGELLDVSRKQNVRTVDEAGEESVRLETDDELATRIGRWMEANQLDFAKLYREIRPSVSQTAENLFSATQPEARAAGQTLRDFVNWIDGPAVDDLIASGDQEVADAAMTARDYYREEYAPFWRDGVLADFADTYRTTVGRTSQEMRERGLEIQPRNFAVQARQQIEPAFTDPNREFADQVVQLLARPEGGQNPGLVTDFILGDVVGDLATRVRAGSTLSEIDLNQIVGRLNEYGSVISQNFPEQAARIGQFIDNLSASRGNADALRTQLETAQQAAQQAKNNIYNNELSSFFNAQGVPNPNGYAVFETILNNKNSSDVIQGLLQRADESGNPLVRQGMQAVYARFMRNKFLGATEEVGGNRILKLGPEAAIRDQVSNVLDYGRQIFSDRPAFMEATEQLLDLAGVVTRSKGAKAVASDSPTAARSDAIAAANRIVTAVIGPLSRTGARVRTGLTTGINRLAPDQAAFRILDAMYSDPEYFTRVADRVIAAREGMDPAARDALFAFLVRSGIYTTDDEQDFIAGLADSEMSVRDGVNRAIRQTDELLFSQ